MLTSPSIASRLQGFAREWLGAAVATVLASALLAGAASPQSDVDPVSDAECMQRCFDEYIAALHACEPQCTECAQWLGPICILRVLNQQCFDACAAQAKAALRNCQAGCGDSAIPA